MAKSLNADLISGFFSEWSFNPRELGFNGNIIQLGKPIFKKWIRHLILKWRFSQNAKILENYDTVIFSGDCLWALRHVRQDAKKIYYCHTPPRYLFDFRERYLAKYSWFARYIIGKIFDYFAHAYIQNLSKFDTIFTNSINVQERLKRFCWYDSILLYPPTDIERFSLAEHEKWLPIDGFPDYREYYFSFSRLSPPKRVDMVIDAFLGMPDKKLIFSYGTNDPQKDMILAKIYNAKNIFAIEAPKDDIFIHLIQWAIATIYIPIDEDFWMSPVESMSCGVPVIGVNDWGLKETIIDWKTGFLMPEPIDSEMIRKTVNHLDSQCSFNMSLDCREQAILFSLEKFQERLQSFLN